jgi:hypothetical protein
VKRERTFSPEPALSDLPALPAPRHYEQARAPEIGEKVVYDRGPGQFYVKGEILYVDEVGAGIFVTTASGFSFVLNINPSAYIYLSPDE